MAKASWITICSTAMVVGLSVYVPTARGANLLGASVTGSIHFANYPSNYYDPANGFAPVPPGYLNSLPGTNTVTIQDPAIEFGFWDIANLDTADFTDTPLIISDVVKGNGANNWIQTFTSPVFAGIGKVADNFEGGVNATLVGNTITLTWAGTHATNETLTAVFNITVPEPSTLALLALGAFGLLACRKFASKFIH
jgi:hypothetical protein